MVAARGGADPNSNSRLRLAVEQAKKASMPKDTLERAIKKGAGLLDGLGQRLLLQRLLHTAQIEGEVFGGGVAGFAVLELRRARLAGADLRGVEATQACFARADLSGAKLGGLRGTREETMRAAAAPSAPAWQQRWEAAVQSLGLPVFRMPSGAGHDAQIVSTRIPGMARKRSGPGGDE